MCRHIVVALGCMHKHRISVSNQSTKEVLEVSPNIRIGVLLDQERSRGMAKVNSQQAILKLLLRYPGLDVLSEFVKSATARLNTEFV
jgi:hypothetical protein